LEALFHGQHPDIQVRGVMLNAARDELEMEIDGHAVPQAEEVRCIVQRERLTFTFEKVQ